MTGTVAKTPTGPLFYDDKEGFNGQYTSPATLPASGGNNH